MKNKPFVKICGITRQEDFDCAIANGADAIGFIAYPKSPRYIPPQQVEKILKGKCFDKTKLVAVFVDASKEEIQNYLDAGIQVAQLHGKEPADFAQQLHCEVWKAVRLQNENQISEFSHYPAQMLLIDSFDKNSNLPGGTGIIANWELAKKFIKNTTTPTLLAGGINAENVQEAYNTVKPYGFDLSSSLEISPGIKSQALITAFFTNLKKVRD